LLYSKQPTRDSSQKILEYSDRNSTAKIEPTSKEIPFGTSEINEEYLLPGKMAYSKLWEI
jgi:hypothetical protein